VAPPPVGRGWVGGPENQAPRAGSRRASLRRGGVVYGIQLTRGQIKRPRRQMRIPTSTIDHTYCGQSDFPRRPPCFALQARTEGQRLSRRVRGPVKALTRLGPIPYCRFFGATASRDSATGRKMAKVQGAIAHLNAGKFSRSLACARKALAFKRKRSCFSPLMPAFKMTHYLDESLSLNDSRWHCGVTASRAAEKSAGKGLVCAASCAFRHSLVQGGPCK
jgi:hypothetical protein